MIQNYNDFISALLKSGFSGIVAGKDDGVFSLFRYGWGAVTFHVGNSVNIRMMMPNTATILRALG